MSHNWIKIWKKKLISTLKMSVCSSENFVRFFFRLSGIGPCVLDVLRVKFSKTFFGPLLVRSLRVGIFLIRIWNRRKVWNILTIANFWTDRRLLSVWKMWVLYTTTLMVIIILHTVNRQSNNYIKIITIHLA